MEKYCKHCQGTGEEPNGWTLEAVKLRPEDFNRDRNQRTGKTAAGVIDLMPHVVSPLLFNGSGHEKCVECGGDGLTPEYRQAKAEEAADKLTNFFIDCLGQQGAEPVKLKDGMMWVTIQAYYNDSDAMTDYFNPHHSIGPTFALAQVKKGPQRESTARKVINAIPELAKLEWEWHKQNWSMGHGYWLEGPVMGEYKNIKCYDGRQGAAFWYEVQFDSWTQEMLPSKWYQSKLPKTQNTNEKPPERHEGVTFGSYKGHPTITLPNGSRKGFTFGVGKAKAILEHLEEIRKFVEENS